MEIDISLYKKVSDRIEKYRVGYKNNIRNLSNMLRNKRVDIRHLYYILKSLKIYDSVGYASIADEAIRLVISSQINSGEPIIYEDKYWGFKEVKTATEYFEGGFPDRIEGNKKFVHTTVPSIDSTIYAIQSIVEYSAHIQYWDRTLEEAVKKGMKYLKLRDLNKNSLLEQTPGEDWIPLLKRGGALLYTNALYLKLLEDLYYLYIDKDREFREDIKSLYTKVYRTLEENFWMESLYIESINTCGSKVWRAGIDSSAVGRPIIMKEANKIKRHFNTLYERLQNDSNKLLLSSETRVKINPEDRNLYRISSPLQVAIYAMDVAEAGYPNLALRTLERISPYRMYNLLIIDDKDRIVKKIKDGGITLNLVTLATYRIISGIVKG